MAYPSRGEWAFRNVTKGAWFWPTLQTVGITESYPDDVSVFSCQVVDPDGSMQFDNEDKIWVKFDGHKIFGGHIKVQGDDAVAEIGPRVWDLEGQDYTAKLDDSVIDQRGTRKAESADDRVAWILSFLNFSITTTAVNLPSETVDAAEYEGMTVREALDQVADELRLFFYLDYGPDDGGAPDLHMARNESPEAAPFDLDDDEPDFVDTFPYTEYRRARDSVELANAVLVLGEKRSRWETDASSISTYGRQERSVQDEELITQAQLERGGLRALAQDSEPQIDGSFVCWEPGLRAGMRPNLRNVRWGRDEPVYLVQVDISAVDPHDENDEAYMRCEIGFTDRRRAKFSGRRVRKGTHADPATGDAVTVARYRHTILEGRLSLAGAFRYESLADDDSFDGPDGATPRRIGQNSNVHNIPWTAGVCPLGLGGWGGFGASEQWFEFTAPDMVGVIGLTVEVTIDDAEGAALDHNLVYGIAHATPTPFVQRDFDPAGTIPAADGTYTFTIPATLITPSATNYLVLAAEWDCIASRGSWVCINDEPGISDVEGNGLFLSGGCEVDALSMTEALLEGGGLTPWVSGQGVADGTNREYTLVDWNGKGVPTARIGAVVMARGIDYDYDDDAGTVTFHTPPAAGSVVAFRYRT